MEHATGESPPHVALGFNEDMRPTLAGFLLPEENLAEIIFGSVASTSIVENGSRTTLCRSMSIRVPARNLTSRREVACAIPRDSRWRQRRAIFPRPLGAR
jgi:hypothetical protein